MFFSSTITIIIIKSGSGHSFKTQPGSKPGFQVLTGSPGRLGQLFKKKNQNNGFVTGFCRVNPSGHIEFFFSIFSLTQLGFNSKLTCRTELDFKTIGELTSWLQIKLAKRKQTVKPSIM
jgi:hypothetical protein